MRRLAVLAAVLSCAWMQAAHSLAGVLQPEARAQQTGMVVACGDGTLAVAGLRFQGCPRHALRALLLPDSPTGVHAATADQQLAAAPALDFERTYDRASDSWSLSVALPAGRSRPVLVQLWCRACRVAGSQDAVTGLVTSHKVEQGEAGAVVLVLEGALLPPAAGAAAGAATAVSSAARKLQQAANCAMTLGGTAYTFASCTQADVSARFGGSSSFSFTVYSTVTAAGSGSLLQMGLVAKTGGGWAGWGLPKFPGMMLGASAVIVWPTATGAEVAGYLLPERSYEVAAINAAKGTFPITQAAAENDAGELRAVLSVSLPNKTASAVAGAATNYIYAIGPVAGAATSSPVLQDHALGGYPYGSGVFEMKQASTAATPTPASPAQAASAPPSPAAAAPAAEPTGSSEEQGDGSVDAAAAPSPAPSPANSGGSGCTLQLAEGAAAESFTGCTLVSGVGSNFHVMWRTEAVASNPAKVLLTMGMNATSSGYVAVGFPSVPGRMAGATAMVLQACTAGGSGCASGAQLGQWYMSSTRRSDVNPSTNMATSNVQAAALASTGQLVGSFQIEVDAPPTTGRRRRLLLLEGSDGSMPLIFAAGDLLPGGALQQHYADGAAVLPLASTSASSSGPPAVEGGSSDDDTSLRSAHAWMAAIGWGVLIPVGIVMARSFKEAAPLWFHLHRGLQTLGFVLGTISLGLGFQLVDGQWETTDTYHTVHRNLGVACTVLGFTQFSALVVRPKKGDKYRFAWELWHAWVGRAAAVLAIANIYYGILHMWDLGVWTWASYTAVLCSIVAVSVVKDTSDFLKARRLRALDAGHGSRGDEAAVQLTQPPSKAPNGAAAFAYDRPA